MDVHGTLIKSLLIDYNAAAVVKVLEMVRLLVKGGWERDVVVESIDLYNHMVGSKSSFIVSLLKTSSEFIKPAPVKIVHRT